MKPTIKQKKDDPVNLDISTEESDIYEYMEHKMLKKMIYLTIGNIQNIPNSKNIKINSFYDIYKKVKILEFEKIFVKYFCYAKKIVIYREYILIYIHSVIQEFIYILN